MTRVFECQQQATHCTLLHPPPSPLHCRCRHQHKLQTRGTSARDKQSVSLCATNANFSKTPERVNSGAARPRPHTGDVFVERFSCLCHVFTACAQTRHASTAESNIHKKKTTTTTTTTRKNNAKQAPQLARRRTRQRALEILGIRCRFASTAVARRRLFRLLFLVRLLLTVAFLCRLFFRHLLYAKHNHINNN